MPEQYGQFGGPLGFRDASAEVERTAKKAGQLIDRLTELLDEFAERWRWLLFKRK